VIEEAHAISLLYCLTLFLVEISIMSLSHYLIPNRDWHLSLLASFLPDDEAINFSCTNS